MILRPRFMFAVCAGLILMSPNLAIAAEPNTPRLELAADFGWKFALGDLSGAADPSFEDSSWRSVDLPHDWSIEGRPNKDNPTGSGGGFYPAGVGWYRKTFRAPVVWRGKLVSIEFDGVYKDATVYLNGQKLGTHPYGYTGFSFDLSKQLDFTGRNVLAVRVDNSAQPNSRWYSGSGIYRHVRVVVTDPTHVPRWGVFVTSPKISDESASVAIQTMVANESPESTSVVIETTLYDRAGHEAGTAKSDLSIAPGNESEAMQMITVSKAVLWSPASPTLYSAVSKILKHGKIIDQVTTPFGIRSLSWSADNGLLLNGKAIKLTGGSVHHDNGPLGAAAFDRAEERKVELLKAAGHNAVRTAHNPPSPAFLDACDRLGLLVLDEPFDTWRAHKAKFDYGTDFDEWWKRDISSMVLRDRNHPSIVIWGIGNEIPELEVEQGKDLGKQLVDQMRSLDTSRPLTLAFPGTTTEPNAQAVFSMLDIAGYNYNILPTYAEDHRLLPKRIMLTTESFPAKAFPLWKISQENAFVLGDFAWTSMDYLGESGIGAWSYGTPEQAQIGNQIMGAMMTTSVVDKMFLGMANGVDINASMAQSASDPATKAAMAIMFHGYPWHAAACGDLDLTGYRKPQSYYRDILWNGGDRVYATVRLPEPDGKKIIATGWATYPTMPSWNWQGQEGKELQVEVYSGAEKVRLFLNDKLIGEKPTTRDEEFKASFSVPYAAGKLKAVGMRGDRPVAESILVTAGNATTLRLTADRTVLRADGQDLSFIAVEAVDRDGRLRTDADQDVHFSISGPGVIAAVGNGDGQDEASYQGDRRKMFQGRALVVVRSTRQGGPITVKAQTEGLSEGSVTIKSNLGPERPELR